MPPLRSGNPQINANEITKLNSIPKVYKIYAMERPDPLGIRFAAISCNPRDITMILTVCLRREQVEPPQGGKEAIMHGLIKNKNAGIPYRKLSRCSCKLRLEFRSKLTSLESREKAVGAHCFGDGSIPKPDLSRQDSSSSLAALRRRNWPKLLDLPLKNFNLLVGGFTS